MKELSIEEINKHINEFTPVYNNDGKEVNPVPSDKKLTVYCGNDEFMTDVYAEEMGMELFIVKSWIYQDDLQRLCK